MTTKLGKVATYHNRLLPLKLHDPLITWKTCGYLTTLKNYISCPLNSAGWWLQGGSLDGKLLLGSRHKRLSRHRFLVFFPVAVFGRTGKIFCSCFIIRCTGNMLISLVTLAIFFFFGVEHNIPCALEINNNGGFRPDHEESCS